MANNFIYKVKKIIVELLIFRPHLDRELARGDALLVDGGDDALVVLVAVTEVSGENYILSCGTISFKKK